MAKTKPARAPAEKVDLRSLDWPEAVPLLAPENIALCESESDHDCVMTLAEWASSVFQFSQAWEAVYDLLLEALDEERGAPSGRSWSWELEESGDGVTRDNKVTSVMLAEVWKKAMNKAGYNI